MSRDKKSGDSFRVEITGDTPGQIAVGKGISQVQSIGAPESQVSEEDISELRALIADLRTELEEKVPPEQREAALERVQELEEAVTAEEPDLTTMEYVKGWFGKNLPSVAGSVTSVVVHPIVGKLVEASGDALAAEFRRRFSPES